MKPEIKLILSLALVTLLANLGAWYYRRVAAPPDSQAETEDERLQHMIALCRAGKGADARAEARDFLQRYPHSPLRGRVIAACPARP